MLIVEPGKYRVLLSWLQVDTTPQLNICRSEADSPTQAKHQSFIIQCFPTHLGTTKLVILSALAFRSITVTVSVAAIRLAIAKLTTHTVLNCHFPFLTFQNWILKLSKTNNSRYDWEAIFFIYPDNSNFQHNVAPRFSRNRIKIITIIIVRAYLMTCPLIEGLVSDIIRFLVGVRV